jgi:hypothetical protein
MWPVGSGSFEAGAIVHGECNGHLWNRVADQFAVSHCAGLGDHPIEQGVSDAATAELRTHVEAFGLATMGIETAQRGAAGRLSITARTSAPPGGAYAPGNPDSSASKF